MTKREEYGLSFYKWKDIETGKLYPICKREKVGSLSNLQLLSRLDSTDTQILIDEIFKAQANLPYDNFPSSDSYEDILIEYNYPNVIIDGIFTISMNDFRELLEEWKNFIQQ